MVEHGQYIAYVRKDVPPLRLGSDGTLPFLPLQLTTTVLPDGTPQQ
jgi:hypothetical protein